MRQTRDTLPIDESETIEWEPDRGVGRIRAASHLTILSHETSPDELMGLVGLAPEKTWSKGEQRRPGRMHSFNGVSYESGIGEHESPTAHLASLLDRSMTHAVDIAVVAAMPKTHSVRVYVVEHREGDNFWAGVDPQQLSAISDMGAALFLDVYFYGDD